VIKIFTLETKEFNEALARLKEPVGENAYVFRYTKQTFEGDKDYYFCHGNQQCPKCLYILRHIDSIKSSKIKSVNLKVLRTLKNYSKTKYASLKMR
jgi:hypothetical protein